ncbi:hypothetical protein [Aeromicrobium sp. Sec7.5]|uniref:hypothetical protein n=1 Tax=Aeromicrobium sp. Sec7.5 TaxID=3121276 RepID=UPI002FE479BF
MTAQTVLVVSNHRDFAADQVISLINQRPDWSVERWNTETLMSDIPNWEPDQPPLPSNIRSVWLRQFLPDAQPTRTVAEVDDFLVRREQWRTRLELLTESAAKWMNPLFESRRAENKLIQLRTASRVGLNVPPTLVTNSRNEATQWAASRGSFVVKTVASGYFPFSDQAFTFTTDLDEALTYGDHHWAQQPVIVQQRVAPRTDIRVFVVEDAVFGASTVAPGTDWRLHASDTTWEPWPVPETIAERSKALVRAMGLTYGALDFASDASETWFLECNQAGEFAFIDRPLALGVTKAIAKTLCT